ncbi:MAG: PEGA domain-containing protein [Aquabacterium sp.]
MKKIALLASLVSVGLLSGCASVIRGTSDTVTVNSLEKGTTIYINGAPRGVDVAQVQVKRGNVHQIRVEKEGCQPVAETTSEKFDATSLLGILLDFGLITIPVDLISGAAWKAEPTTYTVTPICPKK